MSEKKHHVLIIGTVWPEPGSSAAGSRMIQLIQLFRSRDWDVIFASSATESEYSIHLELFQVKKAQIELNSASFDRFIHSVQPSVVLFDRFMTEEQYGWRVAEQCPDAIRILDTEDLHCLRKSREAAWKEGREFLAEDLLNSEVAIRELASIFRCDLSLIISEFEMSLLTDLFRVDESLLIYTPFLFNGISDSAFSELPAFEERDHFITIGNFLHEPNRNSVKWLKEEVWPLIRKELPEAKIHNYGAYPSKKVQQLHNEREGFLIHGRADSAGRVIKQAKVLLAPLRFGAGLKGKLTDAMRYGTPSVTTSIGAEGLNGNLPWPGFIADSAKEIASTAVKLYQNKSVWHQAQEKGRDIINRRFSADTHRRVLNGRIDAILSDLKHHRESNFIGSMLMHHHHASTKYMSRWIEEKNRPK